MSQEQQRDQWGEQLSALVDGELGAQEQSFLLRRLSHDPEARARLARFYLMRDALQRSLPPEPDPALAERVRARLVEEPVPAAAPQGSGWRRPAAGGLLAAAVAAVTVVWWQGGVPWDAPDGAATPTAEGQPAEAPAAESEAPTSGVGAVQPVTLGGLDSFPWPEDAPAAGGGGERAAGADEGGARLAPEPMPPRLQRLMMDHVQQAESDYPGSMLHQVRIPEHGEQ